MKRIVLLALLVLPFIGNTQVDLPITFEDTIDYMLVDFGGNASSVVVDPTDSTNRVGQAIKNVGETFAGTVVGNPGLANPIPFDDQNTIISVRVWSPTADTPIRLKVENSANGGIFAELDVLTTVAGEWETLNFDFANPVNGALNLADTYDKIIIFFDFGTVGNGETYYWDDIIFAGGGGISKAQVDLPITFEDTATVDYALADFGGNMSMIVVDPTDATNLVGEATKMDGSEVWAGTTMGGAGLVNAIPFTNAEDRMTVMVWSPDAGIPVRLKVENAADPGISVETDALTTLAGEWEMLTFDFTQNAENTAAINYANTYDKVSIFFDFGTVGSGKTYYWDNVMFVAGGGSEKMQVDLPITFEDTATVDYALADFGGNMSMIVVDPTDATNLVGEATKMDGSEVWAGTTMGGAGLASAIPFTNADDRMTVMVWSPDAGIPVRLKIENAADPGISVETDALTTLAGEWEMLTFDFTQNAENTAAINYANTYDKVSIFFDFGTVGSGKTYYWDNVMFVAGGGSEKMQLDLPITFEDTATVDYNLGDFGGNISMIVTDPTDSTNTVGQATKMTGSEVWAGTTVGGLGLANPIPLDAMNTRMSMRVWSPTADTPVRLKIENATTGALFVEAETNTTAAETWETLVFDMADAAGGVLDLATVYDKVSVFFNFGTSGTDETYFFDDIEFIGGGGTGEISDKPDFPITFEDTASIDYNLVDFAGNVSMIVVDPTDETNLVAQAIRSDIAETFAGTVVGNAGLANPIPFTEENSSISVRVWSPEAGVPVMLKVEQVTNGGINIETQDTTTVAGDWETLVFDFSNPTAGTSDLSSEYDKLVIFFNFGTTGAVAGEQTFYWDDMIFVLDSGLDVLDFEDAGIVVSPNPASHLISIESEETFTNTQINVFDGSGRLVKQDYLNGYNTQLDVSDLTTGIYYLKINKSNQILVNKLSIIK